VTSIMRKIGVIWRIVGQVVMMLGRLGWIVPAVCYQRWRGATAFEHELHRCGVPPTAARALRQRYVEMIPLNPRQFWPEREQRRLGVNMEASRRRLPSRATRDLDGS